MLFTSNWYPFELGKALDDAIVRVLGGGRPEFFERLGAASAEKNLTTIHAGFLTKGDAHGVPGQVARLLLAVLRERAAGSTRRSGPKEGVFTTYDAETFSAPDCLTVVGWYRKALEMCGVKGVKIIGGGVPGEGRHGVPVSGEVGVRQGVILSGAKDRACYE